MRLKRETTKKRAAEPPAVRLGLKPPGGGRIKWIKAGFAWDLFVLSPLNIATGSAARIDRGRYIC